MHDPMENLKVRVRCPECRVTFRSRIHRLLFAAPVTCPVCRTELNFRIAAHAADEEVRHYVRYVEGRTRHPHFYVAR